ncbi:hypothetical protein GUJ93_ZPchr0001g32556 [Zizania palustris]|uniref:Pentatricopeptide repeat-containing protein n=1 Tax=Zizania palustris TaxID=103762 RepID=A0A8J5SH27_ZIZPA|nr:hypothetical protein GUJ93_ZPchr0001g32556 [Zizania palustris]
MTAQLGLNRLGSFLCAFFLACGRLRHGATSTPRSPLSLFACHPRPHVLVFNSLVRSLHPSPACSPLPLPQPALPSVPPPQLPPQPFHLPSPAHLRILPPRTENRALVVKSGFARDLHVRSVLLARYAACDLDLAHAEQLFDEMPRPKVVSWTTMITSYRNRGRTFHALATFRRMLAAYVAPNGVSMVAALGACATHCAVDTGI